MKIIFFILILIPNLCLAEKLIFTENGFTINSLESADKSTHYRPLMMFLPPKNGLGQGVTVQIQPTVYKTMKEYVEVSNKEFPTYGIHIIESEIIGNIFTFEYIQVLSNKTKLYGYTKIIKKENVVYMGTATSPVNEWEENEKVFKETVNSLELLK